MGINSSQSGALLPDQLPLLDSTFVLDVTTLTSANLLDDDAFHDFFHDYVMGITGLAGALIVPRWQPDPPNISDFESNWCAFGITDFKSDVFAAEIQKIGYCEIHRHEIVQFMLSFYGKNSTGYARLFRDGVQLSQNHEILSANSMGLVETGDLTNAPAFIKERWQRRIDLPFSIRRQIIRTYPILEIMKADITFTDGIVPIVITN